MIKVIQALRPWTKTIVAAVGAVLVVLNESGMLTGEDWFTKVVAVATVLGVYQFANIPKEARA